MHDQRLTTRLTDYWQRLKGAKSLPSDASFNPAIIQDLWPNCMKLIIHKPTDHSYSFHVEMIGEELAKLLGRDLQIGMPLSAHIPNFPAVKLLGKINIVMANPTTLVDDGQFINHQNKIVKYRSCLLPFGNEEKVTHCIIGFSWKTF